MRALFISANTERINVPTMPVGLACVAEATRSAGHEIFLVDLMAERDPGDKIRNEDGLFPLGNHSRSCIMLSSI